MPENYGQVIVSKKSGIYHEIKKVENNSEWKLQTGCGYLVTEAEIMSPQKAEKRDYEKCEKERCCN